MQADEEREKNGSEDDDEEKPGKRVIGPRKKFHWDDTIRWAFLVFIYRQRNEKNPQSGGLDQKQPKISV